MFLRSFLNLIFPARCAGCEKTIADGAVCDACFSKIRLNKTLFCGKCRLRLADNKKVCHKDHPFILGSACDYGDKTVKALIRRLKFNFAKDSAEPLAKLLINYVESLGVPLDGFSVVPVPISPGRLRERGFNQSELVGGKFAEHFKLELRSDAIRRVKNAKPQSETKTAEGRRKNVKDCFFVGVGAAVVPKNIILIDDVVTSGATISEAARALKAAGAKKIVALTVAMA